MICLFGLIIYIGNLGNWQAEYISKDPQIKKFKRTIHHSVTQANVTRGQSNQWRSGSKQQKVMREILNFTLITEQYSWCESLLDHPKFNSPAHPDRKNAGFIQIEGHLAGKTQHLCSPKDIFRTKMIATMIIYPHVRFQQEHNSEWIMANGRSLGLLGGIPNTAPYLVMCQDLRLLEKERTEQKKK